ncbi:MAG: GAF domain-containing protein [Desulfobacteraceae bacterium]|nr:GAF domain-containing protein [Desulfobacteraceae bacterium]
MEKKYSEFLRDHSLARKLDLSEEERAELIRAEKEYLIAFISTTIQEAEEVMGIDPRLPLKRLLEIAAARIAECVNAEAASIRLFDPKSLKMLSFGASGFGGYERLAAIPVENSIAGKVVRENRSIAVPSILKDPLYKDKEIVHRKGFRSLLAVPMPIPRFMGPAHDFLGSLQIYYREEDRQFDSLERIHAEMLARRVSYVVAKRKILDLQELNQRKEKISNKVFVKLSNREAIKLRDLFLLLIPELGELMQVQSCSLFTVSEDQRYIHLEAAYPLDLTYHEISYAFTVRHHPYFIAAIHGAEPGDRPRERVEENYILLKDPRRSSLTSPGMREYVERHQIHSILLVPLRVDGTVRHLLTFYASEQKEFFTDEEIELLIFFGKEIMKASKLEYLGDILHDIKNPAIALAGFASRARKLLASQDLEPVRAKLASYLDILAEEAARLQDLAITLGGEGREEVVDLGREARERFLLNREVIRESKRANIEIKHPELEPDLLVSCPPYALERVLDNLLNNATKAIPRKGGLLALRCYREDDMACLEITNTGEIPSGQLEQARQGLGKGRGLGIIYRFVQANRGRMEITAENGLTTFLIKLPLQTKVLAERLEV